MPQSDSTRKGSKQLEALALQLEALAFGLGLRISQAKQVAEYWVTGRTYFDVPRNDSPESGFDFELFALFRSRVLRAFRITTELQKILPKSGATKLETSSVGNVRDECQKVWNWRPLVTSKDWTYDDTVHEGQIIVHGQSSREAEQLLIKAEDVALTCARQVARHRDSPLLEAWLQLGLVISECFDERDTAAPADEWPGLEPLEFTIRERFSPKIKKLKKVERLADELSVPREEIALSSWNPNDPVQKLIIDEQTIPDIFPGWFSPELLFRTKYSGRPRECFGRDQLFLFWAENLSPSESKRVKKIILERWNDLAEAERQKICPDFPGVLKDTEPVKGGLRKAKTDRKLLSVERFGF